MNDCGNCGLPEYACNCDKNIIPDNIRKHIIGEYEVQIHEVTENIFLISGRNGSGRTTVSFRLALRLQRSLRYWGI